MPAPTKPSATAVPVVIPPAAAPPAAAPPLGALPAAEPLSPTPAPSAKELKEANRIATAPNTVAARFADACF